MNGNKFDSAKCYIILRKIGIYKKEHIIHKNNDMKITVHNQGKLGAQSFIAIGEVLLLGCSNLNENYAHINKNFYECT